MRFEIKDVGPAKIPKKEIIHQEVSVGRIQEKAGDVEERGSDNGNMGFMEDVSSSSEADQVEEGQIKVEGGLREDDNLIKDNEVVI